MANINIEITKSNEVYVTYNNDVKTVSICNTKNNEFHINKEADNLDIILIASLINHLSAAFTSQLIQQGFVNKALNKPTDNK